ncbi:PQQ-binding-like beta-propeller repeat protein [Jidongwangia harbinensis]|uniref:PQQ-binding-like beta-propeller repeat protein n=1 Tax=Jidongwangia harbinensis TaxID=2878561 RepID=UPI001CD9AC82|nr:PQQ-binding-like beta-propeller repeat protein [Jidongwangia harbinensis]MCA2216324.1 PQQ-binding-like beta-propeller repeat protein [Jidongwangia harbinensis]MCA2217059.1 PQQ-binding-like beta-propeller repeat protein [Jidongwangia harbinensis]
MSNSQQRCGRRTALVMAAAAVLAAANVTPVTPAAAATPPSQWAQAGYGPGHTYYNPQESVINTSTIKKLKLRWSVTAEDGEPGCSASPGSTRVVDGRMFMISGAGVAAFDVKTGARLWSNTSFSYISAELVVVGGLLLVTDTNCYSNSNYDGYVTALDVRTGTQRWRHSGSWMVDTVVADAGVVITSGYCGTCDGFEHGVIGIRASDGVQVWSYDNTVLAGPVSASGRVLLRPTDWRSDFVASAKTGALLYTLGSGWTPSAASPAGDRWYLTSSLGLSALDAKNGKVLWTVKRETGDLAADANRVYVASAGRVNAYQAKTGKLAWTRAVVDPEGLVRAGGLLYVTSDNGSLSILSPSSGKTAASGIPYGPVYGVIVAGGRLYTRAASTVAAFTP